MPRAGLAFIIWNQSITLVGYLRMFLLLSIVDRRIPWQWTEPCFWDGSTTGLRRREDRNRGSRLVMLELESEGSKKAVQEGEGEEEDQSENVRWNGGCCPSAEEEGDCCAVCENSRHVHVHVSPF